jgi:ATP-binding cassette subfamily B protein
MRKFPFYKQHDEMDCGPTCLRIISKYYGKTFSLDYLRALTHTGRTGTTLLALSEAAEQIGFRTMGSRVSYDYLMEAAPFPCVAYWGQRHYVVLYKAGRKQLYVSDPAHGLISYTPEEFRKKWVIADDCGIILSLEPTAELQRGPDQPPVAPERGFKHIASYLTRYRKELTQILAGLIAASLLQLLFPLLTQSIVDEGIAHRDIPFIYLVLGAQLAVFLGKTTMEVVRSYILLHLSARININLLTDFFVKLMRLPLGYFDTRMMGDILQRINDHRRIETFLTGSTLSTVFSLLNLVIFSVVLALYNGVIFAVFVTGSILYVCWILAFMRKRAELDYKLFTQMAANQEKNYELIVGMQEIKLHNAEKKKRWQWELLQIRLFRINIKTLSLRQFQSGGAIILNELKNIFIAFLAAKLVVEGRITLGIMLSISYITGQLNAPILQLIDFLQAFQDARLSMERINEIHNKRDEENHYDQRVKAIPTGDIVLNELSFKYDPAPYGQLVLDRVSLRIPAGKVTAIVGSSGSGKTTLLKLLLKFYEPSAGALTIAGLGFETLSGSAWRDKCGVVLQDGFIFNDTIAGNIAVGEEHADAKRLVEAATASNIHDFVASLPLGYKTLIGDSGLGISAGQKQRLLIARAVYKDPDFLFFDEATSALDAQNERTITQNLQRIFAGKTVVIIAHRLSTVRNADRIIVLDKGRVSESGRHEELITDKGFYYQLISNQLELGA